MRSQANSNFDNLWCYALLQLIKNAKKKKRVGVNKETVDLENMVGTCDDFMAGMVPYLFKSPTDPKDLMEAQKLYKDDLKALFSSNNKTNSFTHEGNKTTKRVGDGNESLKIIQDFLKKHFKSKFNPQQEASGTGIEELESMHLNIKENSALVSEDKTKKISQISHHGNLKSVANNKSLNILSPRGKIDHSFRFNNIDNIKLNNAFNETSINKIKLQNTQFTKNSFRKIPTSFLRELGEKIPEGRDELAKRRKRLQSPKRESVLNQASTEGKPSTPNSQFHFCNELMTETYPNDGSESNGLEREGSNINDEKRSWPEGKVTNSNDDIINTMAYAYKRVALALQDRKNMKLKEREQEDSSLSASDSLGNLRSFLKGKEPLLDVRGSGRTKVLESKSADVRSNGKKIKETARRNKRLAKTEYKGKRQNEEKVHSRTGGNSKGDNCIQSTGKQCASRDYICDCHIKKLIKERKRIFGPYDKMYRNYEPYSLFEPRTDLDDNLLLSSKMNEDLIFKQNKEKNKKLLGKAKRKKSE